MARLSKGDGWTMLQPAGGDTSVDLLFTWCKDNRAKLHAVVYSETALLLRGWDIHEVAQAERIIFEVLAFDKMEMYPPWFVDFNARCERLDVAPGGLVQKALSRNAPDAAPLTMQPPHVEFGLGPHRPRVCGFFCEQPPAAAGETALFYFPAAGRGLY